MKCRRRSFLQYELGYDKDEAVMGVGRVVHALLNGYYTGASMNEEDQYTYENLSPEDRKMCHDMFDTYVTEVEEEGLDIGQTTIVGEKRYTLEVGGLTLTGQIDALVQDDILDGVIVRDHKTVGQFMNTAQRDFQLMTYAVMAWDAGYMVKAIEHNQIKRNKRTSRSNPPYIRRDPITVTEEAIESHRRQLAAIVSEYFAAMNVAVNLSQLGLEDPRIWAKGTNECSWQCPFFEVCGMIDDGEDYAAVLETEYHRREAPVDIT